eukprot:12233903-Prorocentrum_lima.AAC.1
MPRDLHPEINCSLMNSPPFSDCTLTICMPDIPLSPPNVGSMSRTLRISLGASDFNLSGATHGM